MIEIRAKLKIPRAAYKLEVKGQLRLPFASRQKSGVHARLVSGEEVVLNLPSGEVLRGGDLVTASDGRVIEAVAEPEKLLHAVFAGAAELAKAAYRLGDRHVLVEFRSDGLRIAADSAVGEMLKKMGATLSDVEAPFEPEIEAGPPHGQGHEHHHHHGHDHDHDHKH